jgi:3-(3-hydroxy-phenyl)propionate hydroxylase
LQDCNNMAWKLAFVVRGWSDPALLHTYSSERVQAARDICEEAGKSTRFMTPPTRGGRLMRDAVLSFCLSEDFLKDLLHWRTSRPHNYQLSALNSYPEANAAFADGIACGQPARNVKLADDDYLFDRFDAGAAFHVLIFARAAILSADVEQILLETGQQAFPVIRFLIGTRLDDGTHAARADLTIEDGDGRIARKYGAQDGTVYVLRPDLHVCARWLKTGAREVCRALRIAACTSAAPAPEHATDCPSR